MPEAYLRSGNLLATDTSGPFVREERLDRTARKIIASKTKQKTSNELVRLADKNRKLANQKMYKEIKRLLMQKSPPKNIQKN